MKKERIEFIKKYVSNDFFDQEKLIKYLDMHTLVGNEVFEYVDRKNCVKKNRKECHSYWLDDSMGYEPVDVDTFIKRVPFYFYVWDGSMERHSGDLGILIYATYENRMKSQYTLEELYQKLEYLFYDQKIELYDIFNYMIEQTGVVTQHYFYDWVDYLRLCEKIKREINKMPDCFIATYNQLLEELHLEPIRYEISEIDIGKLYWRDGKKMLVEGVFPIDELGRPIMKWSGLKIINGGKIWNCSCEKSQAGRIGIELTPNIIIYYWTEVDDGTMDWRQLYVGPQNMEFDYTILKSQRKFYKMTQKEVADAIGANVRTYQKWEKGETQPDSYFLLRLVNWLDIPNIQDAIKFSYLDE